MDSCIFNSGYFKNTFQIILKNILKYNAVISENRKTEDVRGLSRRRHQLRKLSYG
ncbi:protein of unknown function [Citrobacter freundii]|nr:protein of unknown function [Citrobacter freundii]